MKALVASDYGVENLGVEDILIPEPGPGQMQVRVTAAGLNSADLAFVDGSLKEFVQLSFPVVPGMDFAGTVSKLGAGVAGFHVGDEIFGFGGPETSREFMGDTTEVAFQSGTIAEYLVIDARSNFIRMMPAGMSPSLAAALPAVGLTAQVILEAGKFAAGERVLVVGATGGVGSAVLPQLAATGAHVIATGHAEDEDYLAKLGAAEFVDYRAVNTFEEIERRYPDGVDTVLNLALAGEQLFEAAGVIRPGGKFLSITRGTPEPERFEPHGMAPTVLLQTQVAPEGLAKVAELALAGTWDHLPSAIYPLDESARAFGDFATKHIRGKLVVNLE